MLKIRFKTLEYYDRLVGRSMKNYWPLDGETIVSLLVVDLKLQSFE